MWCSVPAYLFFTGKQDKGMGDAKYLTPGDRLRNVFEKMSLNASSRLLRWQLRIISLCEESGDYFINVPARLLCQSELVSEILPSLRSGIVIEVQDPCNFILLTNEERDSFNTLHQKIKKQVQRYG